MDDNVNISLSERSAMRERQPIEPEEDLIIKKMAEKKDRIPKDYQHFEKFIKELVDGDPPQNVIFSIWNKLCLAEEKVSGQNIPPPLIDLSGDENNGHLIISERPPETGDLCYDRSEFEIYVPKPNNIPLDSDDPLAISDASKNDTVRPKVENPFKTWYPFKTLSGIEEPRRTWYLPPVQVNEALTTSASLSHSSYPPCSSKNNLEMNLETNAFEDIPKDELSQQERRKEKPTLVVKPLKVVPANEPGTSTAQSSEHEIVNPNDQPTRPRERDPLREERLMRLKLRNATTKRMCELAQMYKKRVQFLNLMELYSKREGRKSPFRQ